PTDVATAMSDSKADTATLAGLAVATSVGTAAIAEPAINLGTQPVAVPTALAGNPADLLHESRDGVAAALAAHRVPPRACIALLHAASPPDLQR
ncbi:hypothetical protein ACQCP8_25605, partial [Ralstonia pseudosolanacearum]